MTIIFRWSVVWPAVVFLRSCALALLRSRALALSRSCALGRRPLCARCVLSCASEPLIYIYIYIYVCMYVCMYIYIYIYIDYSNTSERAPRALPAWRCSSCAASNVRERCNNNNSNNNSNSSSSNRNSNSNSNSNGLMITIVWRWTSGTSPARASEVCFPFSLFGFRSLDFEQNKLNRI